MSHKKAGGSTRLGRDSQPKYLGVKVADGQKIRCGGIIVRQKGTKIHPGKNAKRSRNESIYALVDGVVKFTQRKRAKFDGSIKLTKFANVIPTTK